MKNLYLFNSNLLLPNCHLQLIDLVNLNVIFHENKQDSQHLQEHQLKILEIQESEHDLNEHEFLFNFNQNFVNFHEYLAEIHCHL